MAFQQRPGDSAGPEVDVASPLLADRLLDRHVGDLEPAAGAEHTEDLREDGVLVRNEVDDAVGDRDVEAFRCERELLDLSLDEVDVRRAHLRRRGSGPGEHLRGHVDPGHLPRRCDHLGGDERVGSGAAANIDDVLAWCEPSEREQVGNAGERLDRRVGDAGELRWIVEVFGPGAAGGEDEVFSGSCETEA
jgi:hypothetical protein